MNEVRLGVIGCGGMAQGHMGYFKEIPRLKFTAACDTFAANVEKVTQAHGVTGFADADKMLDSGLVDAVLIGTPHYFHPQYSIAALTRGIHVLTEKPVSVTAKAAAEVNEVAAKHPKALYAAMFQMRTEPRWKKIKSLITTGSLGTIQRMSWTATNWLRTQAYYDSGSWRATWKGEGGGVLINQCPHNLDLLCWLLGTPTRVTADVSLGKHHKIEVEDDVTALLKFANGSTGVFIASTGEAPGTDHVEIVGDRGRVTINTGQNGFDLVQYEESVNHFIRTTKQTWSMPQGSASTVTFGGQGGHKFLTQNFVEAILDGVPLIAPGAEGLASIELANAIIMSGLTNQSVNIPTDRAGYEKLLTELIAKSGR